MYLLSRAEVLVSVVTGRDLDTTATYVFVIPSWKTQICLCTRKDGRRNWPTFQRDLWELLTKDHTTKICSIWTQRWNFLISFNSPSMDLKVESFCGKIQEGKLLPDSIQELKGRNIKTWLCFSSSEDLKKIIGKRKKTNQGINEFKDQSVKWLRNTIIKNNNSSSSLILQHFVATSRIIL